jgi:hypothetical protein
MEQLCLDVVLRSKFKLIMELNSKKLFLLLCSYLDSYKVPSMHACNLIELKSWLFLTLFLQVIGLFNIDLLQYDM